MSGIGALVTASGVLKRGSHGAAVVALQLALAAAGYRVASDGDFGTSTEAAVKAFQASRKIISDGVVGLQTAWALDGKTTPDVHPTGHDCPAGAPAWLQAAWKEIGVREVPPNKGPAIRRYIGMAHVGAEGEPWCAIFANAMLESAGVRGTRSASSQSFAGDSDFVRMGGPALGAIAVFFRNGVSSGLGHVGFYCGERGGFVWTLGGNEGDMVQVEMLAKAAGSFGLRGYYWPRSVALPKIEARIVDASIPSHLVSVT